MIEITEFDYVIVEGNSTLQFVSYGTKFDDEDGKVYIELEDGNSYYEDEIIEVWKELEDGIMTRVYKR